MRSHSQLELLRSRTVKGDDQIGVDRKANVIRGYVVAEEGRFKTADRGEFDLAGLQKIVDLGNAQADGVRQRFQHPSLSDDGLGTFTGRAKNFRLDRRDNRYIVRADAHMDKTALEPGPKGGKPIGTYLMDLAESDPGALQTSVAIKTDKLMRENDADGNRQPPLWYPTELQASDWVDRGDAVHGDLLSGDSLESFLEGSDRKLPSKLVIVFDQYLSQVFPNADREFLETRLNGLRDRILSDRFGADDDQLKLSLDRENEMSVRDQEIKTLCDAAGIDSAYYLNNATITPAQVKDDLFQLLASNGSHHAALTPEQKAYDELGEEWDSMRETMLAARYPRDQWIRDTAKDRTIGVPTHSNLHVTYDLESLRQFRSLGEEWDSMEETMLAAKYPREEWIRDTAKDRGVSLPPIAK